MAGYKLTPEELIRKLAAENPDVVADLADVARRKAEAAAFAKAVGDAVFDSIARARQDAATTTTDSTVGCCCADRGRHLDQGRSGAHESRGRPCRHSPQVRISATTREPNEKSRR